MPAGATHARFSATQALDVNSPRLFTAPRRAWQSGYMPRKTPGPPCSICNKPSVAKGFCDKHYRRWSKFGDTTATLRPDDWGKREGHALNQLWRWTARSKSGRVVAWNDFWAFVADVGERPNGQRLRRHDSSKPWGPDNFYWKMPLMGGQYTAANAKGRRLYQREWRANNRLRSKGNDLRSNYGIGLEQFDSMVEAQGGKCAICRGAGPLCVDHCHASGVVRGLLCHLCNRALGLFNDDASRLQSAIEYLSRAAEGRPSTT